MGAYLAALVGAELGNLLAGKTKVDIVLLPLVTIVSGGLVAQFCGPGIQQVMLGLGNFINLATELHPIPLGIIVSLVMGMVLTLPISSAAIAISLNLSGIAAGAATVGCCANMIGFAVASYKENGWGGLDVYKRQGVSCRVFVCIIKGAFLAPRLCQFGKLTFQCSVTCVNGCRCFLFVECDNCFLLNA